MNLIVFIWMNPYLFYNWVRIWSKINNYIILSVAPWYVTNITPTYSKWKFSSSNFFCQSDNTKWSKSFLVYGNIRKQFYGKYGGHDWMRIDKLSGVYIWNFPNMRPTQSRMGPLYATLLSFIMYLFQKKF